MGTMNGLGGLFSWQTLLTKAGVNSVVVTLIAGCAQWVTHGKATGDWTPPADLQTALMSLLAGAMAALWAAGKNWSKNHPASPFAKLFGAVLLVVLLQGCATATPALAGKTNLTTKFSDVVTPDGGQNTQYEQTVKAPAGVQLENIASMGYKWNPDGSGDIAIASAPKADTQGQADALVQVSKMQAELIGQLMTALIQAASPLVGQKISADAASDAASAANRAQLQALIAEAVKEAMQQAKPKAVKVPKVVPTPLVDDPGASLPDK